MRDDALGVEELDRAQAVAARAGAHRVVEREQARLELGQRVIAQRARELGGEQMFLSAVGLDDECAPIGVPQRGLEGFGEALLGVGAHAKPIDHHVHRVLHVLRQARRGVELVHSAVDAHAREALRAQLIEQLGLLAFTPRDHRREDHELRVLGQREHLVHHLRHGLRLQRQVVLRAVRRADARVQQPQIVVDLGHGADGGARVMAPRRPLGSSPMLPERMSGAELRAGASLAGVYGLRMLGLFFILPVFAVHAAKLKGGGDLALVGIALGAYGLSQGILQIPFGLASDRWGRKPALYTGLVIFAAGSFLGVAAHDVWTAIAARTLQGAGAINSVAMALAADLTREQHRTKIMAMIGATIGSMFALSLVGAPLLYRAVGMDGIFALTGLLSLAAIWVVKFQVPAPPAMRGKKPQEEGGGRLFGGELLRLNAGIFVLHVVLYAMFVVVPPLVVDAGLELPQHWKLYLPVVLVSFALMVPPILYADRRNRPKPVLLGGVALLLAVEAGLAATKAGSLAAPPAPMLAFFVAFNLLEAMLPSLVSRLAPSRGRGVAIGVYNTTQTLGVFFGGLLGGWIGRGYRAGGGVLGRRAPCAVWLAGGGGGKAPRPPGQPA